MVTSELKEKYPGIQLQDDRTYGDILIHCREKKRKSLFVNTEEANKETTFIITEPTPVGKRDIDIPASSLRQKYDK